MLTGEQKIIGRFSKRRNSTAESEKLSKRSKVKKEVSMCADGEVVDLTDDQSYGATPPSSPPHSITSATDQDSYTHWLGRRTGSDVVEFTRAECM